MISIWLFSTSIHVAWFALVAPIEHKEQVTGIHAGEYLALQHGVYQVAEH